MWKAPTNRITTGIDLKGLLSPLLGGGTFLNKGATDRPEWFVCETGVRQEPDPPSIYPSPPVRLRGEIKRGDSNVGVKWLATARENDANPLPLGTVP